MLREKAIYTSELTPAAVHPLNGGEDFYTQKSLRYHFLISLRKGGRRVRFKLYNHQIICVPTPVSVKISRRTACSTLPSIM